MRFPDPTRKDEEVRFPTGPPKRYPWNSRKNHFNVPVPVGCAPQGGAHRSDELVVRKRTLRVLDTTNSVEHFRI